MVILGQRLQTTAMARFRPRLKAQMIPKALNPSGLFYGTNIVFFQMTRLLF